MVLASVKAAEGVGWPEALPLLPHPAELIIGLIAFAILYWIYATKVVPKMEVMYEERAAAIEGGMQQAEEAQAEARAALEKYNAQLAGARTEANEIRETAREQGASIVAEMRGQAQAEAARITERAQTQLAAEREQVVRSLRAEVGTLATQLAERVVGESLADDARAGRVVERFLAELESEQAAGSGTGPESGPDGGSRGRES